MESGKLTIMFNFTDINTRSCEPRVCGETNGAYSTIRSMYCHVGAMSWYHVKLMEIRTSCGPG